ncbi:glutathione S-transferase U9-like isoform X2 [Humulus lupulus]|uniref:glutathione S-transferase U9-like isoform X2 n=1 Tax=Humulus lupulus TaxID=3486 RepID=UPI002B408A0D|nr:glutathione S-transferase U9-like isoform X2 [Humulus lupulus]
MAEEHKVKLHGAWTSPYTKRVELALKLKGILFEYVVEDLVNQSPLLLKYNPVHKKVPVLVHNGKSISESSVILEYIDETWPNALRFLPKDPYKRAKVRFWAGFFQQHLYETMFLILKTDGETQEKAIKELSEKFGMLEEGMKDLFPDGTPFDDRSMGLLDILLCSTFGAYKAQEEVLGLKECCFPIYVSSCVVLFLGDKTSILVGLCSH